MGQNIDGKWIRFVEQQSNPKTRVFTVVAKGNGAEIGRISWWAGWRRYCFFPYHETIYEQDCLREIAGFIERLTKEHKGGQRA